MADARQLLKDAFYVTVGLGVITFQRAQVQRQEIRKQVESQVGEARDGFRKFTGTLEEQVQTIEERLDALEGRVDEALDQVEEHLPEQAREIVHQARTAVRDARGQLREIVRRNGRNESANTAA